MTKIVFGFLLVAAGLFAGVRNFKKDSALLKYERYIYPGFAAIFILLGVIYNARNLNNIIPFISYTNQHIYQQEHYDYKILPDAYLRELIKDKAVIIPYEVKTYDYYNKWGDEDERADKFSNRYYIENNYTRYFEEYSGDYMYDNTLPDTDRFNEIKNNSTVFNFNPDTKDIEADKEIFKKAAFDDLGCANDMLRYSFLLNQEHSKETAYFWYAWFYYSFSQEKTRFPHIYVMRQECEDAKELIAVWDKKENLYILPSDRREEFGL